MWLEEYSHRFLYYFFLCFRYNSSDSGFISVALGAKYFTPFRPFLKKKEDYTVWIQNVFVSEEFWGIWDNKTETTFSLQEYKCPWSGNIFHIHLYLSTFIFTYAEWHWRKLTSSLVDRRDFFLFGAAIY